MPEPRSNSSLRLRIALPGDIPRMREIIEASVRGLQPGF